MALRNLNPQAVIKICRSPSAATSNSREQDKKRYRIWHLLFSCLWKVMSVYWDLSCFRMTHLSADVDSVQVGQAMGLRALASSHWACQACCKGSASSWNPSSLETARAVSHFLLMRSYMAGGDQINLMEIEKLFRNGISRVVVYILLSKLFLVTVWNSRSDSGMRSHVAWGKHAFGLPHRLLVSGGKLRE